jgi:hypothetical protein
VNLWLSRCVKTVGCRPADNDCVPAPTSTRRSFRGGRRLRLVLTRPCDADEPTRFTLRECGDPPRLGQGRSPSHGRHHSSLQIFYDMKIRTWAASKLLSRVLERPY